MKHDQALNWGRRGGRAAEGGGLLIPRHPDPDSSDPLHSQQIQGVEPAHHAHGENDAPVAQDVRRHSGMAP
jgi:hypothetical protein